MPITPLLSILINRELYVAVMGVEPNISDLSRQHDRFLNK